VRIETSSEEAIKMLQRYDSRSAGRLDLDDFTTLVSEFNAYEAGLHSGGGGGGGGGGGVGARGPATPATPATPSRAAPSTTSYGASRGHVGGTSAAPVEEARRLPDAPPVLTAAQSARLSPPAVSGIGAPEEPPLPPPPAAPPSRRNGRWPSRGRTRGRSRSRERGSGGQTEGEGEGEGDRRAWGAGSGGVLGTGDEFSEAALEGSDVAGVLRLLKSHAGGKTLHPSQHWVVRAMRALELRYQAAAREESVQRFNLEVHAHQLAHDLAQQQQLVHDAEERRRIAEADSERARDATGMEQQMLVALKEHNRGLVREKEAMVSDLSRQEGELKAMRRENELLRSRWEQATSEAAAWADRAYEAQAETARALAEANEARSAAKAIERSVLTAQEYRMAEEAGYQMQTIIQLAPSKQMLTPVYEQPQTTDAWVAV
jgi:hypothetical protein